MPLYDYKCREHGVFQELAAVSQGGEPCACPQCGTLSARVIRIPPEILAMAPNQKKAKEHEERMQDGPLILTAEQHRERDQERQARARHKGGCGCSSHHAASDREISALKQQVVYLPDGSKVFPSQRPWMISH